MRVLLHNPGNKPLSIDVTINSITIRDNIQPNKSINVGDKITASELNQNKFIRDLVSSNKLIINTESEVTDIENLMNSQIIQWVQPVAATQSELFIGTVDSDGIIQVEAQVGAIPAAGESIDLDVLVNGVSIVRMSAYSTGSLTAIVKEDLADNNIFTLDDGVNPATVFEFNVSGSYTPTPTYIEIDISSTIDAIGVATAIRNAINGVGAGLAITASGTGALVVLTNNAVGPYNIAITETVANTLTPIGMSGGYNYAMVANSTSVTAPRQILYGSEKQVTVNKGDQISISAMYVAGGSPTPIINSAIRIKILK